MADVTVLCSTHSAPLSWRGGRTPYIYDRDVPRYQCPRCLQQQPPGGVAGGVPLLECIYMMRLLLWDGAESLVVQLWRHDAVMGRVSRRADVISDERQTPSCVCLQSGLRPSLLSPCSHSIATLNISQPPVTSR